jgi:hypothetical protein
MMLKSYVPPGRAMNMFVRHYVRPQHDRTVEGYEEMTKLVSAAYTFNFLVKKAFDFLFYFYLLHHAKGQTSASC